MTSPALPRYARRHTGPTPKVMTRRKRKIMHRMSRAFIAKYGISPVLVRAMKHQLDVEQSTRAQANRESQRNGQATSSQPRQAEEDQHG